MIVTSQLDIESLFRRALVKGDLKRARTLSTTGAVNLDEVQAFRVEELIEGIYQISLCNNWQAGDQLLKEVIAEVGHHATVRWLAWLWRAAAHLISRHLDIAATAADTALAMGKRLDRHCRATTLAVRSAIDFLRGDVIATRASIVESAALYRSEKEEAAVASLWLFWGRIMLTTGRMRQGLRALNQAADTMDEPWVRLPLARHALLTKRARAAEEILRAAMSSEVELTGEAGCLMRLINAVIHQEIPAETVGEYLWLTNRRLTGEVASQVEAFLADYQSYLLLREMFIWDLANAGFFDEAHAQFTVIAKCADTAGLKRAQRTQREILDLKESRKVGLLEVVQKGAWSKVAADEQLTLDDDAEIFWFRRSLGRGDLKHAKEELDFFPPDKPDVIERERLFLEAIQDGRVPLEIAKEYVWISERPITKDMLAVLYSFADENRTLETLRLIIAWDLFDEGLSEESRCFFDELARESMSEVIRTSAEQGLKTLGPAKRHISRSVLIGPIELNDYVTRMLPWPSVLDSDSLLFDIALFELSDDVSACASPMTIAADQPFHVQGDSGELLYIIRSGQVTATRTRQGSFLLGQYEEGTVLGEVGTLYGLPNTANLVTNTECELGVIGRRSLQETTRRIRANEVIKTLRQIYWEMAMRICLIYTPEDEEILRTLMVTQGRCRILQRGERVRFGSDCPLAMLISGIGRVIASSAQGDVTLGFLAPGDLIFNIAPSRVVFRAEKVLTVAEFYSEEVEALSFNSRLALKAYLDRCNATLRNAEIFSGDDSDKAREIIEGLVSP